MDSGFLTDRTRKNRNVLWLRAGISLAAAGLMVFGASWLLPGFFLRGLGFGQSVVSRPLPEFTQSASERWLNSKPLQVADLRGKVVFLEVWTFG